MEALRRQKHEQDMGGRLFLSEFGVCPRALVFVCVSSTY